MIEPKLLIPEDLTEFRVDVERFDVEWSARDAVALLSHIAALDIELTVTRGLNVGDRKRIEDLEARLAERADRITELGERIRVLEYNLAIAIAADKERVRAVVRTACLESFMFDDSVESTQIETVANRAADQLATPAVKLTEEDRNHLLDIRTLLRERHAAHASAGLWSAEIATLGRLLKEKP